jgi:peptide methionine sulfoxide reductase MsrB
MFVKGQSKLFKEDNSIAMRGRAMAIDVKCQNCSGHNLHVLRTAMVDRQANVTMHKYMCVSCGLEFEHFKN